MTDCSRSVVATGSVGVPEWRRASPVGPCFHPVLSDHQTLKQQPGHFGFDTPILIDWGYAVGGWFLCGGGGADCKVAFQKVHSNFYFLNSLHFILHISAEINKYIIINIIMKINLRFYNVGKYIVYRTET